jgi:hypothetical protein
VADLKRNDTSVHEAGATAEDLGKEDAVERGTKSATVAASFTTRDHEVIRTWAESRGGRPADVEGTGDGGGAGVLRIEFRDDDGRLEDVGWDAFFATFDDSDVDFLYQERTSDGSVSRFHKFVRDSS